MGAKTKIEWCHRTFNPHWGCTRVSPGCENCYAEAFAKRVGHRVWGLMSGRREFGDDHWAEPLKWDAIAKKAGERHRVFCASMADVFEDHPVAERSRIRLWPLIEATPHLDWLLLTKRPQHLARMLPWYTAGENAVAIEPDEPWPNVWIGTSVEDQKRAEERIPHLVAARAVVRFLSCEPLLGAVALRPWLGHPAIEPPVQWVIVGGESGHGARRFNVEWARSIVKQCRDAGVAAHVKQMGANVIDRNDRFDTCGDLDNDHDWPWMDRDPNDVDHDINGFREEHQGAMVRLRLVDHKGGDWSEWPKDLRIREYPR